MSTDTDTLQERPRPVGHIISGTAFTSQMAQSNQQCQSTEGSQLAKLAPILNDRCNTSISTFGMDGFVAWIQYWAFFTYL